MNANTTITTDEYSALDRAYDHFNAALFDGKLPMVLITFQRKGETTLGYFSPKRFTGRDNDAIVDEIALNPVSFLGRTDAEILSTLAHEMAHVWQQHNGKPSRNGYHNREWGTEMERIGLMPSNTGAPGGKRTGQQMTHYVIAGGMFESACAALIAQGCKLNWNDVPQLAKQSSPSRAKYTCPDCGQNAWAKPGASLICGDCEEHMECDA